MAVQMQNGVPIGRMDLQDQFDHALAEYEARVRNPRYIPGAAIERPDSPERVRAELIDPLQLEAGALLGNYPPASSYGSINNQWGKPIELPNGEVIQPNLSTGASRTISAPKIAAGKMDERGRLRYQNLLADRRAIMGKDILLESDQKRMADLDREIARLEEGQTDTGTAPMPSDSLSPDPFSFIGTPGGESQVASPQPEGSFFIGTPGITDYGFEQPRAAVERTASFQSPEEVKLAVRSGRLSKADAANVLREQFGFQ